MKYICSSLKNAIGCGVGGASNVVEPSRRSRTGRRNGRSGDCGDGTVVRTPPRAFGRSVRDDNALEPLDVPHPVERLRQSIQSDFVGDQGFDVEAAVFQE